MATRPARRIRTCTAPAGSSARIPDRPGAGSRRPVGRNTPGPGDGAAHRRSRHPSRSRATRARAGQAGWSGGSALRLVMRSAIAAFVGRMPRAPAVVLQQVDPGAAVRRIDHHVQRAVWRHRLAQRMKPGVRVGQMVQHASTDDMLECRSKIGCPLERQSADLEVVQAVLALQLGRELEAGRADVDADDLGVGPAHRAVRSLRRAAARHEDRSVVPIGFARPEEV